MTHENSIARIGMSALLGRGIKLIRSRILLWVGDEQFAVDI